mgnify:CR=1 FL=1
MTKRVLIFGGTGFLGLSLAQHLEQRGFSPVLVARNKVSTNYKLVLWDGYSIGVDIQINGRKKEKIEQFSKEIFNFTKDCDGKIFLAKDEMLDRDSFQFMYPKYKEFLRLKNKYDSQKLFSSEMFQRLIAI